MLIEEAALGFGGEKDRVDLDQYVGVIINLAGTEFQPKTVLLRRIRNPQQ